MKKLIVDLEAAEHRIMALVAADPSYDRYSHPLVPDYKETAAVAYQAMFGGTMRHARKNVCHAENYSISNSELTEILKR